MRLTHTLSVFLGAGLGAVLRWRLGVWLHEWWPGMPAGTIAANLAGCFLIGAVSGAFESRPDVAQEVRLFLATGFLGGFTTFSAFSLDTLRLASERTSLFAAGMAAANVAACVILTFAGLLLARRVLG